MPKSRRIFWRRSRAGGVLLAVALLGGTANASPATDSPAELTAAQLDSLAKTTDLLQDKLELRRGELAARVRGLYKLNRAQGTRLWVDRKERGHAVVRGAGASKIIGRDVDEIRLLIGELDAAEKARQLLLARPSRDIAPPPAESLFRPVVGGRVIAPFGYYLGPRRVRLSRRGIELSSAPGRNVRAAAAGEVAYAGALRGLGQAIVIRHDGDVLSVLGHLTDAVVATGDRVKRGDVVARASGRRVYFELRLLTGPVGFPIDPAPLLSR